MIIRLLFFFIAGCAALLLLTLGVYKTGIVHRTRDQAGHLNKKQSFAGVVIMISVLFLILLFFVLFGITTFQPGAGFFVIAGWIALLMFLLLLFDSFFIDLLLIGKIRPAFLHIPSETTIETMKVHVGKTFTAGFVFIIPIVLFSALIVYAVIG